MPDTCKFSTYGYACGKPVEHGRYLCEEHAAAKCSNCGKPATHGCDFCGQFVCGAPLCDECTFGTDETKASGAWGFMNHVHVSKPEFADKHENVKLKATVAAKDAEIAKLKTALRLIAAPRDCGCSPVCQCNSEESLKIEVDFFTDTARAALKEQEAYDG